MTKNNPVGWFEIPVTDMKRAITFYQEVIGFSLEEHEMGPLKMAWFPMGNEGYGATGSLVLSEFYKPSTNGSVIYFTSPSGDLANELAKVESAGGKIIQPKLSIGEHGFIAHFLDTEGNRVALHSMK